MNLPSIYINKPSVDLPQNQTVVEHLSAVHATRQMFITTESSKNLKIALCRQTRDTRDKFESGSRVYYRRNNIKWKRQERLLENMVPDRPLIE